MNDPLIILPPEIILQIIDLLPLFATARLTRLSKAWHFFVDTAHQDRIYSNSSKAELISTNTRDFSSFHKNCFFEDVQNWKDVCKRQVLLRRTLMGPLERGQRS